MKSNKLSAIALLKRANQNAVLEASFQIPVGDDDTFIDAKLTAPDIIDIWQESELQRKALWSKAQDAGLVGKPINEAEWRKEIEKARAEIEKANPEEREAREKALETMEANPPQDLAEQFANQHAGINVVRNIIPRYLRDLEDRPLFPSEADQNDFRRIMSKNGRIFDVISGIYVSLSKQIAEEKAVIKN